MQNISPQQFLEHVEDIHIVAFSRDVCHNANQCMLDYLEPPANGCQPAVTLSSVDILSSTADN